VNCDGRPGGNGISSTGSTVALYDSSIFGGGGGSVSDAVSHRRGAEAGRAASRSEDSLFASRTLFEGGQGGMHWNGGDGGDGLEVDIAEADLRFVRVPRGTRGDDEPSRARTDRTVEVRTGDGDFEFLNGIARIFSAPLLVADNGTLPSPSSGWPATACGSSVRRSRASIRARRSEACASRALRRS
jgi:hypothetical protein